MPHTFQLFWLRETGCDAGTRLRADELEPEIQEPILALVRASNRKEDRNEFVVRLPFFDKNEWRRRGEILAGWSWERDLDEIFPTLSPHAALRDLAAQLALGDPTWANAPTERDPNYFRVWQSVSLALQQSFRTGIAEAHFQDVARFENRSLAHTVLAYEAARRCHGRPNLEFTYDLRDYPHCVLTLALALKMTGRTMQANLARVEKRLRDAGNPALARRYAPIWYEDILREVRAKPRRFIALLAAERRFINAVIELGANRTAAGVNHFAKAASQSLRNICGMDLHELGSRALIQTTYLLSTHAANARRDGMVEENPHEFARTSQGLRP